LGETEKTNNIKDNDGNIIENRK